MITNKPENDPTKDLSPELQEFLTDPKFQKQRDGMNALIDLRLAEKIDAAKVHTSQRGGNMFDNIVTSLTGGLFDGSEKK